MKGLLAILGKASKDKGAASEDEALESSPSLEEDSGGDDVRDVMVDAAKAGDWESFADAVMDYAKSCASKG